MSASGPIRKSETTRDDWATPDEVYEALAEEFSFDIDGAADENNHKVAPWFGGPCTKPVTTIPEIVVYDCVCGLCGWWCEAGSSAFLNPPFGMGLSAWVDKCIMESEHDMTVVATLPNSTEAGWFKHAAESADEVRLVYPRIQYIHSEACPCKACKEGKKGSNTGGTAIFVWRPRCDLRPNYRAQFSFWTWKK